MTTPAMHIIPDIRLKPLCNRDATGRFTPPADGWFHLAPMGAYPHTESKVVQVLDPAAISEMVNRFRAEAARPNFPGVLVDFDHFSYDNSKASEAAGWITDLDARPDGLWGRIRWTSSGEDAITNGRYRFISPVWLQRDTEAMPRSAGQARQIRPLRLDTAGLTNSPNLRGMVPLSNRSNGQIPFRHGDAPAAETTKQRKTMKSVMTLLGLSADASEEAALDAVTKLKNRAESAETALTPAKSLVTELETQNAALLAGQVDADLEKYSNRFKAEDRDKVKAQLLKNRADTIALLELMPATPATQATASTGTVLRNRDARSPGTAAQPTADKDTARRSAIETYRLANRCSFEQAYNSVRSTNPELFAN